VPIVDEAEPFRSGGESLIMAPEESFLGRRFRVRTMTSE
jgi:hypothetical protein